MKPEAGKRNSERTCELNVGREKGEYQDDDYTLLLTDLNVANRVILSVAKWAKFKSVLLLDVSYNLQLNR